MNIWKAKSLLVMGIVCMVLCCAQTSRANAVWHKGTITKNLWMEDDGYRIQVNEAVFQIPSDVPVYKRYERRSGSFGEEKVSVGSLYAGMEVSILAHDNTILQVIVWD